MINWKKAHSDHLYWDNMPDNGSQTYHYIEMKNHYLKVAFFGVIPKSSLVYGSIAHSYSFPDVEQQ